MAADGQIGGGPGSSKRRRRVILGAVLAMSILVAVQFVFIGVTIDTTWNTQMVDEWDNWISGLCEQADAADGWDGWISGLCKTAEQESNLRLSRASNNAPALPPRGPTAHMPRARVAVIEYCSNPPACVAAGPQTDARATTFLGLEKYESRLVRPGERLDFRIIARDANGTERHCGGDSFQVQISGPSIYHGHPIDHLNGTYSFSAILFDEGRYTVRARLDFRACTGSVLCNPNSTIVSNMMMEYIGQVGSLRVVAEKLSHSSNGSIDGMLVRSTAAAIALENVKKHTCGIRYSTSMISTDDASLRVGRWVNRTTLCHRHSPLQLTDNRRCRSPFFRGWYVWVPVDAARPILPAGMCRDVWIHFIGDSLARHNFIRLNSIMDTAIGLPTHRVCFALRYKARRPADRVRKMVGCNEVENEGAYSRWMRYAYYESHNITLSFVWLTPGRKPLPFPTFREWLYLPMVDNPEADPELMHPFPSDDSLLPTHVFMNNGLHHVSLTSPTDPRWMTSYYRYITAILERAKLDFPAPRTSHYWISTAQTQFTEQVLPAFHRCATNDRVYAYGDIASAAVVAQNVTSVWDFLQFSLGRGDATDDNRHYNENVQAAVVDEMLNMVCACGKRN